MPASNPWIRYRDELFLGVLLLAFLLMISAQVTAPGGGSLLKQASYQAVAPLLRAGGTLYEGGLRAWNDYFAFRRVVEENARQREALERLQLEKLRWEALRQENARLRVLLDYQPLVERPTLALRVLGRDLERPWRMVIVNRGSSRGLRRGMPVLSPEGVVGRVLVTSLQTAQLQLITDSQSAVSALHLPSGEQVLLRGQDGPLLKIDHFADSIAAREGDLLVTAGLEGIYPEDYLVAYVEKIERLDGHQTAWARPAASMLRLRDLLALLGGDAECPEPAAEQPVAVGPPSPLEPPS